MKQKELAVALKGIVILCLLALGLLALLLAPSFGQDIAGANPEVAWMFWPCLIYLWLTCVPVLIVLVLVWRLATEIGRDHSFCPENARRLKCICCLAIADTGIYVLAGIAAGICFRGLPPILLLPLFFVLCLGVAISVVAAVLSHLVQKGADLQAEQDLTI